VINAPLDSTSSNAAFDPGDLLPGFQILDNPGPGTLIVLGAGTIPTATRSILANLLGDSMDVLFPSGVAEVGFDFWTTPTAGQITALVVTITVFDTNGNELGVVTPTSSASGATFFGVISDAERIGRVNLFSATPSAEVIDNLAFSAPEPGSWILLSSGLALLGLRRRRKS
jgi:hypothetical protein